MISAKELQDMITGLSPHAYSIYDRLSYVLQEAFSLHNLISIIEQKKPLVIEDGNLDINQSGLIIEIKDAYFIYIRSGLNNKRKLLTLLHEISHILLGHLLPHNITIEEMTSSIIEENGLYHEVRGMTYEIPREHDAESLATVLYFRIEQCEIISNLPSVIKARVLECFTPIY